MNKLVLWVSKEQWSSFKSGKKEFCAIELYESRGKRDDWIDAAYPPQKLELNMKELKG